MRIDVSEQPVLCDCDTCVQHRTLLSTQETEPTNVTGSSLTPVPPVSTGPVQALGSTSDQSSGTESPLTPVTTSVIDPEPAQSINSTIFKFPPASTEPAQALSPTASGSMQGRGFGFAAFAGLRPFLLGASATSQANGSSPISFAPPVSSAPVQAPLGTATTSAAPSTSSPVHSTSSPTTFQFHPAFTSAATAASGPSLSGPIQAPAFGSAFPPPAFGRPDVGVSPTAPSGYFHESNISSPFGRAPKNPFGSFLHPGFGARCPSNPFGPNPQTTIPVSGRSPFWGGVGTGQGSRYPRYAPTPDLLDHSGGQGKVVMSISASNSHGHKSHEELRWEDYKKGDKGGLFGPPAHTQSLFAPPSLPDRPQMRTIDLTHQNKGGGWFPPRDHSPSLFAPPSRPDRPQMRTFDLTHQNPSGFPIGNNIPSGFQRPHEPAGVSSPASGCTACGATSSSSPSVHLGLNGATNPPSSATSLPGLFFPTYGSCPIMFATPNLAAQGTITAPAVQAYAMMFGPPNLAVQGTITTTPAVQAYPMMFGIIPNLATQGTTTAPAVQAYPMMFGTPNHVAQGTITTPAQPYPTMFGTPSLAAQGIATTPAAHPYPMMFGTPNHVAQGTTLTAPAAQPYLMMFGTPNLTAQGAATTTPAAQPYAMMFGTPNLGAQGITPAAQAYPVHGLNLPFSAMSLQ